MILHILRMRRNVNRNVFNARKKFQRDIAPADDVSCKLCKTPLLMKSLTRSMVVLRSCDIKQCLGRESVIILGSHQSCRGKADKVGPSASMQSYTVTAFQVCNAVKATIVVFTDPPGGTIQRRICFFGANAKR